MDPPATKRPSFSGDGFLISAILAPGMALGTFYLGTGLMDPPGETGGLGALVGSFLFLLLIVSFWGALPSMAFGGLALAAIQRLPRLGGGRFHPIMCLIGGAVAAGLYALAGLGVARVSQGAALFFAPWATRDIRGSVSGQDWWLIASLLLAGSAAGLIYSAFAKRG